MDEPSPTAETVKVLVANHARFLAFLAPRVGSAEKAEEILQAAFVKAIERGGELRDDESATAWFYRLLRNALIDDYRHQAAETRALEREAREALPVAELETGLEKTVCACIKDLIPTLKPEYEGVLRRVELEGASLEETARTLGITRNNATVRLHRARQALRKQLERACGTCTHHGCLECTCGSAPRPKHKS